MLRVVVAQLGANFVGTFILIFFATAAQIVNQKYGGAISPFGPDARHAGEDHHVQDGEAQGQER
jgi:glycerol uptake facilitator-like aquaporin